MAGRRSELRPCACALEGGDGAARQQQGGSRAASGGRQRLSAAAGARAACLNACARREGRVSEGEREEREKGSGERN